MNSQLLFILKAPLLGTVKTRLSKVIGEERACATYKAMVGVLFNRLAPYAPFEIHYTPLGAESLMKSWLSAEHEYFPQATGDLGRRMEVAVAGAFTRGAPSVILLGGDCPYITPAIIGQVDEALEEHDVVIGPAVDGGYYLLALNQPQTRVFEKIPWSTELVFNATLKRIEEMGLSVKTLPPLEDVDDLQSWKRAEASLVLSL